MDQIIDLAEKLGQAIADSPQAAALREARDAMNAEPGLRQTLTDFQAQSEKIAQLNAGQGPVEVDDKHRLQELHDKLMGSDAFKKLTAAQVEYVDLMRRVSQAMQKYLAETEQG